MSESIPLVNFDNLPNNIREFEFSQYERSVETRIRQAASEVKEGLRRRIPWKFTSDTYIDIPSAAVDTVVDLSGATSTTALLGAGATTAGGAATAGATVGTAGAVAVGGAVVGGILGEILTRGRGATLPGHHFVGPGNPVDEAPPVDVDDVIAKQHDIAYSNAKTVDDVHAADKEAIKQFRADFDEHGNLHSKLGELGLTLKHNVEKFTGVLYPPLSGTYK